MGAGIDEMRKVPGSESAERAWMSNDKVQFDNLIGHCKALMQYSEMGVSQALAFQHKANDIFLTNMDAREKQRLEHEDASEKQRMEHENELETQRQENNRFTLDYLYGVYPQEAVGLIAIAKALADLLKKEGLVVPKE